MMQMQSKMLNGVNDPQAAVSLARQHVYRFLALALSDPRARRWQRLLEQETREAVSLAADLLRSELSEAVQESAPGELPLTMLDLRAVCSLLPASPAAAVEAYQGVFGLMAPKACPPYETEYCSHRDPYYRAHQMADVSGFYRAFGLQPSRDVPDRHDHAALELEFMAWLIARQEQARAAGAEPQATICLEAQHKFLRDHLSWWLPTFAFALRREADAVEADQLDAPPRSFYGAVAAALAAFIGAERQLLGVAAPKELLSPTAEQANDNDCAACCGATAEVT